MQFIAKANIYIIRLINYDHWLMLLRGKNAQYAFNWLATYSVTTCQKPIEKVLEVCCCKCKEYK